jgi:4-diphosphocytidyl-2-C-methyl-D-erythritol kinase
MARLSTSPVQAVPLIEVAAAKINLSLRVLGRRPDGYHALESLVCFADVGDRLTLTPGEHFTLDVTGPFASALVGERSENLVARTVAHVARSHSGVKLGAVRLEKMLPIAAGLGGGSADAAAMLRLLMRSNPHLADAVEWSSVAASLGADVPVCLRSAISFMSGIGEIVHPLPSLPPAFAVLANPGVPLSTAAVFNALAASPLEDVPRSSMPSSNRFATFDGLIDTLRALGNDLEAPAVRICPPIAVVLDALRRLDGARLVRMSGSGSTCFALFAQKQQASLAADALKAAKPDWWVMAADLR